MFAKGKHCNAEDEKCLQFCRQFQPTEKEFLKDGRISFFIWFRKYFKATNFNSNFSHSRTKYNLGQM